MKRGILPGLLLLTLLAGCTSSEPIEDTEKSKENPFASIIGQLNVERPTMTVYRSVVEQLSRYFEQKGETYKKQIVLTPEEEALVIQLLAPLNRADRGDYRVARGARLDDVRHSYFNTLADASHLDGCLMFRDAARALANDLGDPPAPNTPGFQTYQLELAKHLFGWTARQLTTKSQESSIKMRNQQDKNEIIYWPAHEVLRLGAGDAEDRVRAFLSLLHQSQYDLDGCAILVKRQERQDDKIVTLHVPVLAGVLIGKSVYLFDPFRGIPVPGPGGQGVATLEQVRKSPELLRGMPDAPTAAQLGEAEVVLLASMCAMAPRMKVLQAELESLNNRVKLAEDLVVRLQRFHAAGIAASPWTDPNRPYFPALTTHRYVETSKGDPRTFRVVPRDRLIPKWALDEDRKIATAGIGGYSLLSDFDRQFIALRLEPGGGRDLLVRGNANQAVSKLAHSESLLERSTDQFHRGKANLMPQIRYGTIPALIRESDRLREMELEYARAEAGSPRQAELAQRLPEVRRAYDSIWREQGVRNDIVNMNREWAMPELREHYTYFLGLAKLELALRAELRLRRNPNAAWPEDLPSPADQFASAAEWFRRYEALVLPTGSGIWLDAVRDYRQFCDQKVHEIKNVALTK